jgi:hypothetical protein
LKKAKAVPLRGEQFAAARIYNGKDSEICEKGSWLAGHDQIRLPNGDLLMTLPEQSVILENPSKAVASHSRGERIYLTKKQLDERMERASTDLVKARESGVLRIPKNQISSEIPTNKYGEILETLFTYARAKAYGDFLHQQGIKSSTHYVGDCDQKGAVARGLWVHDLLNRSYLSGYYNDLVSYDGRVFGVQNVPAERAAPKVPQEKQVLEQRIQAALDEKVPFGFNGTLYVPVSKDTLAKAK